ncbi:hypothetical protein QF031_002015 [Pseudarthrobacter defluvii]|uniref:phosphotransferase n=1 Tax=Pseudarthrobacter defluvii TaxID=410837 RepID=UPI002788094B|nr:phosphotransferase [Pseudarthrobacter defluvii]MDQ0769266.1 hypothetical protein [Pseudarthrobacter defluvii]
MGCLHLLSDEQAGFVEAHFPGFRFVNDLSWYLADTVVLEIEHDERRYVVKAAAPGNHHIGREIDAHRSFAGVWASKHKAPRLVHANRLLNLLVTEYLEGCLVEGTAAEYDAGPYVQAGQLLREFHGQTVRMDREYETTATGRAMAWLRMPHRIEESLAEKAVTILAAYRPGPVPVVPTHGDWQPRNWLINGAELRVIDFGRFAFRPAVSDFCRLAAQQWRSNPVLEVAFFEGYGFRPPGEPAMEHDIPARGCRHRRLGVSRW